MRVLVMSPNWLGDAVMALPAMRDLRQQFISAEFAVAARRGIVDLFGLTSLADHVVGLEGDRRWWRAGKARLDANRLSDLRADVAVLFPNSFASAWLVARAGIRERWGYASDFRTRLLTRIVPRPRGERHQGAYYQHLVHELGCETGPMEPSISVSEKAIDGTRRLLVERGWNPTTTMIAMAPGAAYGKAKQWVPAHAASLVTKLVEERKATCVLVGSRADASTTDVIRKAVQSEIRHRVIDLAGQTSLKELASVFRLASVCVSNDSGAMHVAAAVGTPVIALFGPTREYETAPLARTGSHVEVLTHDVWCRPCMLRECPIDHRCMTGITPERVLTAVDRTTTHQEPSL